MRLSRGMKGSLTVEAALVIPLVVCIILAIAFIMRVAYVHTLIQHALDDSAGELSTYSYLYAVSGLKAANDKAEDTLEQNEKTVVSHLDTVLGTFISLGEKMEQVSQTVPEAENTNYKRLQELIEDGRADIGKLQEVYDEVKGHPEGLSGGTEKEAVSLAFLMAHGLFEKGKEGAAGLVMKIIMRKHVATDVMDENERLLRLNVEGGYEGLDFTGTKLLRDKKSIDITVGYKIKPFIPVRILPDIRIIQRVTVKGWLDGDGKHSGRSGEDDNADAAADDELWYLDPIDRGNEIQRRFGANVLNGTGGAVDIFDVPTGSATNLRSIDITLPSYKDLTLLEREIRAEADKLDKYKGKVRLQSPYGTEKEYGISRKTVRIIIPKGTKTIDIVAMENRLKSYYGDIELIFEEYIEKKSG